MCPKADYESWRVAYTCGSPAGTLAAVRVRLGMTVLPKDMVASDLHVVDGKPMPDLKDTEIAILDGDRLPRPAQRLKDFVIKPLS